MGNLFSVVYVDNHLLVVNKRPGSPTQPIPGKENEKNVTEEAKAWIKQTYHKPGRVFLEPIHRLDRPVSGLVLFARTSKALSRLQAMMRERQIEKKYYAVVESFPPASSGVFEDYLVHEAYKARVVPAGHPQGVVAVLEYSVITSFSELLEAGLVRAAVTYPKGIVPLEIRLVTGRYHQIRIQCASRGLPVLGDEKYQSRHRWVKGGIALHHGKMELIHPVTQEKLSFIAPWPDTFYKIL